MDVFLTWVAESEMINAGQKDILRMLATALYIDDWRRTDIIQILAYEYNSER